MKTSAITLAMPLIVALACGASQVAAAAPLLGSASTFAVLSGSAVTNTGPTVIVGDIGVFPGTSYTGAGSVTQAGTTHIADATAGTAQNDAATAYNSLAGLRPIGVLMGQDLGTLTLAPGVYSFASSAQLTGTLQLDAQENPDAFWVFQIGSSLTTASNSSINVINSANGGNDALYWQIGSSATLGAGTSFRGNIVALTSITLNSGATDPCGSALARNGALTMDTSSIFSGCQGLRLEAGVVSGPGNGGSIPAVPEPETCAMLVAGLGVLGVAARRRQRKAIATA